MRHMLWTYKASLRRSLSNAWEGSRNTLQSMQLQTWSVGGFAICDRRQALSGEI